jgi:hypothetical protein
MTALVVTRGIMGYRRARLMMTGVAKTYGSQEMSSVANMSEG